MERKIYNSRKSRARSFCSRRKRNYSGSSLGYKSENFDDEHILDYNSIFTTAIGAIKDQQRIIESQEEKILSLEEKIARIEKLLNI